VHPFPLKVGIYQGEMSLPYFDLADFQQTQGNRGVRSIKGIVSWDKEGVLTILAHS
jgi:hypothetical protein